MTTTPTFTLSLSPAETDRLRQIAAQHGYIIGRGPKAAEGSIQQLAKALAAGEVQVTKVKQK